MTILKLVLIALATEAAVEIVLHGFPLEPLRRLAQRTTFTRKLFSCGWCLSVWVGTFMYITGDLISMIPVYILVVHRSANVMHAAYERMRKGTPHWDDPEEEVENDD